MRVNDAITGIILLLFATAVFLYSNTFPQLTGMQFSAGFWPQTLSVALGLCGIVLIVQGLAARRAGGAWALLDAWWRQPGTVFTVLLVPGTILFYILASDFLGFIICGIAILFALAYRFGVTVPKAALLAVATTVAMHLIFVKALHVALPWGILEPIFF